MLHAARTAHTATIHRQDWTCDGRRSTKVRGAERIAYAADATDAEVGVGQGGGEV